MINKLPKLPKQLSFSFIRDPEIEKRARLSKQEHTELIQALADFILAYVRVEYSIKAMEMRDEL